MITYFSNFFFFFNDPATTEIYTRKDTLSLHDALPIYACRGTPRGCCACRAAAAAARSEEHTSELQSPFLTSYAVFCLKKKKITDTDLRVAFSSLPSIKSKNGFACTG